MVKEVIWTPEAEASFERVIQYLHENWTDKEIEKFIRATDEVITYITKNPKMFRKTNNDNVHEALVTPHNLLIYKIYPKRIDLIAFWDTRQNPKKKRY
jgi:plasmid stabilization system protein ParE